MRVLHCLIFAGLLCSGAHASTFNIGIGEAATDPRDGMMTQQTGVTTETFGTGHVATDTSSSDGTNCGLLNPGVISLSGDFRIAAGNSKNRRKTPDGDTSCYLSMSNLTETGTTDISFTVPTGKYIDYISFYWGSIDPYNYVQFRDALGTPIANNLADTSNGFEANGRQFSNLDNGQPFASLLAEATFTSAEGVRTIHIRNTNWATEIDNLSWRFATIGVPVGAGILVDAPSSLGLMGVGYVFIAFGPSPDSLGLALLPVQSSAYDSGLRQASAALN